MSVCLCLVLSDTAHVTEAVLCLLVGRFVLGSSVERRQAVSVLFKCKCID